MRRGAARPTAGWRWWFLATVAVLRRPRLWPTALRQAFRLARPGWWRRPPFLPLPDGDYVRFRMQTAYGSTGSPDPEDLVAYLNWCREFKA
ncbi:MAG: hypothetical protein AB1679_29365 [Actinomycetota bacterium]|jgi:hypothetical protein